MSPTQSEDLPELLGGEYVRASDGREIYCKTWHAFPQQGGSSRPRAVVTFIHGLGEHCQRYAVPFTKLAESGIQTHAFDLRGHGRTFAKNHDTMTKGWLEGVDRTLEDVHEAILRTRFEEVPHFLMGMSMGGGIALAAAAKYREYEFAGVIAIAPAIEINANKKMNFFIEKLLLHVVSPLLPRMSINNRILGDDLSRDPQVAEEYFSDALNVTDRIVIGTAAQMINIGRVLMKEGYKRLDMPVLIHVGSGDALIDYTYCQKLFDKLPVEDKKMVVWFVYCSNLRNANTCD